LSALLTGYGLADNDDIALFQFALRDLCVYAVSNAEADLLRLRLLISAEHPDNAALSLDDR
jgi:hypothetical protein